LTSGGNIVQFYIETHDQ